MKICILLSCQGLRSPFRQTGSINNCEQKSTATQAYQKTNTRTEKIINWSHRLTEINMHANIYCTIYFIN